MWVREPSAKNVKNKKLWDENGHQTTKDVAEIEGVQLAYRDDRVIFKSYSAHLY